MEAFSSYGGPGMIPPGVNYSSSVTQTSNQGYLPYGEYGMIPGGAGGSLGQTRTGVVRSLSVPQRSIVSSQTVNGVPVGSAITQLPPGVPAESLFGMPPPMATPLGFPGPMGPMGPIGPMGPPPNDQIRRENEALKAQVHRLKKLEAGWFPGVPEEETKVTVVNNYQSQITQSIEEMNRVRLSLQQAEAEILSLREQLAISQAAARRAEELGRLNARLTSDISSLRAASSSSVVQAERNFSSQLDSLRSAKIDLERELASLRSALDSEKNVVQRLRDEISQLQRENSGLRGLADRPTADSRLPDQLRSLQEQLTQLRKERDRLSSKVLMLESRAPSSQTVERVYDDAGVRERERLIEHYKAKWDELNSDNLRLKSQIVSLQDEIQRIRLKAESELANTSTTALNIRKEKDLQDLLRQELSTAKDDANYYRNENHKLRDQLRSLASQVNKTEIHREVIVDKTGNFANSIIRDPSAALRPVLRPGETEFLSRETYRS